MYLGCGITVDELLCLPICCIMGKIGAKMIFGLYFSME